MWEAAMIPFVQYPASARVCSALHTRAPGGGSRDGNAQLVDQVEQTLAVESTPRPSASCAPVANLFLELVEPNAGCRRVYLRGGLCWALACADLPAQRPLHAEERTPRNHGPAGLNSRRSGARMT